MPLTFKFVGFIINKKYHEINYSYEGTINLLNIHTLFITWDLTQEEINQIKFIIDSEHITDPNKLYTINFNENHIIFVFINNKNIKQKLYSVFTSNESNFDDNEEITQPITQDQSEIYPVLTIEIINKMNENTLLLLSDPDFINILSIYKRKPDLFNSLSNYIQNNDIIIDSLLPEKNINEISEIEINYYNELSIKIMNLQLGIPQNIIIDKLIKYSGHINLTIRSIINEIV